jgi:hypothetical protein
MLVFVMPMSLGLLYYVIGFIGPCSRSCITSISTTCSRAYYTGNTEASVYAYRTDQKDSCSRAHTTGYIDTSLHGYNLGCLLS